MFTITLIKICRVGSWVNIFPGFSYYFDESKPQRWVGAIWQSVVDLVIMPPLRLPSTIVRQICNAFRRDTHGQVMCVRLGDCMPFHACSTARGLFVFSNKTKRSITTIKLYQCRGAMPRFAHVSIKSPPPLKTFEIETKCNKNISLQIQFKQIETNAQKTILR